MKPKLITVLTVLIVFLNSCEKDEHGNRLPYYQFTEDDKSKLLQNAVEGKQLVYRNQENDDITFTITKSEKGKALFSTGTFWGNSVSNHFYYDQQHIISKYARLTEEDTWANCDITLERYPLNSDYNLQYPVEGTPEFVGFLNFPLWNGYNGTDTYANTIKIDFTMPVTSISINGQTFSRVRIFESGKTEILRPDNTLPMLPRNVNKLYYDDNSGVIGFDDINGKQWRLQ